MLQFGTKKQKLLRSTKLIVCLHLNILKTEEMLQFGTKKQKLLRSNKLIVCSHLNIFKTEKMLQFGTKKQKLLRSNKLIVCSHLNILKTEKMLQFGTKEKKKEVKSNRNKSRKISPCSSRAIDPAPEPRESWNDERAKGRGDLQLFLGRG